MKHFKLRKVGPAEGRKVTEIKIVPKVRTVNHDAIFRRHNMCLEWSGGVCSVGLSRISEKRYLHTANPPAETNVVRVYF